MRRLVLAVGVALVATLACGTQTPTEGSAPVDGWSYVTKDPDDSYGIYKKCDGENTIYYNSYHNSIAVASGGCTGG